MSKYAINVSFGEQGYTVYGGIFTLWKICRKELKRAAHIRVDYYS